MNARNAVADEVAPEHERAAAFAISADAALLGCGAVLVWNDIADDGRDAFYAWHDHEHIPERLDIPGFRRGRRFARPRHSPEWLTMYEADDLAVTTSPAYLARLNAPTSRTVATLRHFRNTSRAVCRVVRSAGSSTGGHMLAMRLHARDEGVECRGLADAAFAAATAIAGVVATHLYVSDERSSFVDTAESDTRTFDVPAWVLLCETTHASAADEARARLTDAASSVPDVVVRDAAVYALEICRLAPARYAPPMETARR